MNSIRIIYLVAALWLVFSSCQKEESLPNLETAAETGRSLAGLDTVKVCVDKYLNDVVEDRSALITAKLWPVGQTIRVRFIGGSTLVRQKVTQYAREWEKYANVRFQFVTQGTAEIRIAFEDDGSWSYIGKDALYIPASEPTMNFGWFNDRTSNTEFRRTTLHEFGHALGCIHEHQHPQNGIPWDVEKTYAYYADMGWDEEQVDQNIFAKYSAAQTSFCRYDRWSIMHYAVPEALTVGTFSVGWNSVLSAEDKRLMTLLYPFQGTRKPLNCNG